MSPDFIPASHLDVTIGDELREAQDARWRRQDAKSGISPAPPPKPPTPAPKQPTANPRNAVAKKSATKSPAPRTQKPASGSAKPAPTPSLPPPGSVVLSAADMEVVDLAVDYFVKTHPANQPNDRSRVSARVEGPRGCESPGVGGRRSPGRGAGKRGSENPRSAVEPDPPPFKPRPVEPPYRRRSWPWPYQSRESPVANPNNLNPRELSALQTFFKTRAEQPPNQDQNQFVRREVGKFSVPA